MQPLHAEGVTSDEARDGEHPQGDCEVEDLDDPAAARVEMLPVHVGDARPQVMFIQRVLHMRERQCQEAL